MMATSEERLKILDMIQNGVINAEEGAKLLKALKTKKDAESKFTSDPSEKKTIRVRVTDSATGNAKVSVNLPIGLINAGLNIASNFIPEKENEILAEVEKALKSGASGKIVDVIDHNDGEHIEIYID
jgi:hypothetical protein